MNAAEKKVIGAMLIDNGCIRRVRGILAERDFKSEMGRLLYRTIWRNGLCFGERVDIVSLTDRVKAEVAVALVECVEAVPSAFRAADYARRLHGLKTKGAR